MSEEGAEIKKEKKDNGTAKWTYIAITAGIVVIVAVAWRAVYVTNQRELQLRRSIEKNKMLYQSLKEVPGKRFTTNAGTAEADRQAKLVSRYN
ncbi:hypothetical protein ADEAN_000377200 [Angomonas deanei]|uniref:Uncharacterized protein n=1 Tax=Angomonas deanei TaxID=59799 RepID=A0A7G2C919_9TRYP|nr:hypothetical protein ADEAN_000377200 [Angomonas deanei]